MNKKTSEFARPGSDRRGRREVTIRFPLWRFFGLIMLMAVGGMFVYRLSETGGKSSQTACLLAMLLSFLSACSGLYPVYKVWGKDLFWILLGIFLSGFIRLLIGFVGVVIITVFTDVQRIRFVAFLALFYSVFLAFDTRLALWVLRNAKVEATDKQETAVHGNIWDIISRYRKPA